MRKEAIAQQTLNTLTKVGYAVLVIALLCGLFFTGYTVGHTAAIKEAKPYTMEGVQYVQYGEEVHDYGHSVYVTVEYAQ